MKAYFSHFQSNHLGTICECYSVGVGIQWNWHVWKNVGFHKNDASLECYPSINEQIRPITLSA